MAALDQYGYRWLQETTPPEPFAARGERDRTGA
jgi:hypothetical protein